MLQEEHSAIVLTFIKLPFVIKISLFCLFLVGRFTQVLLYFNSLVGITDEAPVAQILHFFAFLKNCSQYFKKDEQLRTDKVQKAISLKVYVHGFEHFT